VARRAARTGTTTCPRCAAPPRRTCGPREKTVSVHLSRLMAKLGATGRAEAVSLAYDRGLLVAGNGSTRVRDRAT
jgi:hypothetical protein